MASCPRPQLLLDYCGIDLFARAVVGAQAPPEATAAEEDARLDADMESLWTRLQQTLATRRALQRQIAAAQRTTALWETHRESVQQLASSHESAGVEAALQGVQQLSNTLQDGWQLLRSSEAGMPPELPATTGVRGLQQRYSHRRAQISTVGVQDLMQLSSMLTAS